MMHENLFDPTTPVAIQGITGKEGARMARWLIGSGVNVIGGVTPGKGGQEVEGKPVFDTLAALKERFPDVTTTSIVAPSGRVLGAVKEALEAGMNVVHILTEQIPVHDVLAMKKLAEEKGTTILGPSSIGYLQFPKFRLGYLGGENPFEVLIEGGFGIISTSGGMTNELMMSLSRNGIGIRTAMALGGDRVVGTTLEEAIHWTEARPEVTALAVFIEPGRPLLNELKSGAFTFKKPTVVFLAGEALDDLPKGLPYGHTGTVLGEDEMPIREIRKAIQEKGIACVGTMSEFIQSCKQYV